MRIYDAHGQRFIVDCVEAMYNEVHVPLKDMQHLRVCLTVVKENLGYLDREAPPPVTADEAAAAVAASKARVAESLSQGLITFQLKPKAATGPSNSLARRSLTTW